MPTLSEPVTAVHTSFLAAMAEFRAEGRGAEDDQTMLGRELRTWGPAWEDPGVFTDFVRSLRADALEETPRPAHFVPSTTLWWIDGTTYLGKLAIRHRLTPNLLEMGGHIGYDMRPGARRQGHATAMLRAALPVAAALGITSALITCDHDNTGSRKVIEANGGRFEDQRGVKLRYWVPTGIS